MTVWGLYEKEHKKPDIKNPTEPFSFRFKPSLSMKIFSINNFTTKLLYLGPFKGTKKFVCKVIDRQREVWYIVNLLI